MKMNKCIDSLFVKLFNIHPVKTNQVFTPTKSAEANYVSRPELESLITNSLVTPGKQILLFGHSGSGKTTIIRSVLRQNRIKFIKTHCEAASTFNDIILAAFDDLDKFVIGEKNTNKRYTIKGDLASEIREIKSKITAERSEEDNTKMVRLLPPQLTPQKLAQLLGEGDFVWIIEDFHKVAEEEKKRIADTLKIFVDNANDYLKTKIICIGACENATDLVRLEPDLKTRVDEIKVNMLSEDEIRKVVINGCKLLNLEIDSDLLDNISYYSSRIASTAHQMCLDICLSRNIVQRKRKKSKLNASDFNTAVQGYVKANEGSFSYAYEVAVRNELGWYILKTFANNSHRSLPFLEIKRIVNNNKSKKVFVDEEIKEKLHELCSPELGVLYYSSSADKYKLSSPYWQSFLRIQFALEASEQKNSKKRHNIIDKTSKDAYLDELMLELLKSFSIEKAPSLSKKE